MNAKRPNNETKESAQLRIECEKKKNKKLTWRMIRNGEEGRRGAKEVMLVHSRLTVVLHR